MCTDVLIVGDDDGEDDEYYDDDDEDHGDDHRDDYVRDVNEVELFRVLAMRMLVL